MSENSGLFTPIRLGSLDLPNRIIMSPMSRLRAMQEFILPYEVVRQAGEPDAVLLSFLQSTYEAAANLGHWDRVALEHSPTV